jgi:hypothetical protein
MGVDGGQFIPIILDLMKRGFLDLLGPSNDPEFFWQVISGPPVYARFLAKNALKYAQICTKYA